MTQTTINWVQDINDVAFPAIEIKDAYETYYATLGDVREEDAVESFVHSYDYNEAGTEEALRAELQVHVYETSEAYANEQERQKETEAMTNKEFDEMLEAEGAKADAEYERKAVEADLIACDSEPMSDEGDPDDLDAWRRGA